MSWRVDRTAVVLLIVCQVVTGVAAAVLLTATARAMRPLLGGGPSPTDCTRPSRPARRGRCRRPHTRRGALAMYAERRITRRSRPRRTRRWSRRCAGSRRRPTRWTGSPTARRPPRWG
ncbi:hypothetical protein NKH77_09695 [Streptomyces sp. M19]